ncbi:MAG TPA: class I SAM-dependent methyltransferase [Gammaproteobacteria bacterium]|nr:class I SAM-dependent methyltransferase [Gammaproteobacteria bacterium]
METRQTPDWDSLYENATPIPPAEVLSENLYLLPQAGKALDLACGLAENAFLLAAHDLRVDAWDNSEVAIKRINEKANRRDLAVSAKCVDVMKVDFPENCYDVIVSCHFLEQRLTSSIVAALKPGGLLFYQTFTREKTKECGPKALAYQLKSNELLTMFSDLQLVVYREEACLGDTRQGFRDKAMMIGLKKR